MTKEFFEEVMRIPTCSGHEDMMIEFLMDWGPKHGCKTTKDAKGNVYMEKGSAKHPVGCINHTDTVHRDQAELVDHNTYKEIIWKGDRVEAVNPFTKRQTGLGMDNQGGCVIALAVIEQVPAIKAMFPVEEEIGCHGTHASRYKEFFKDCSFVFSNDSPDRNRATHYSSGTQLYSDKFFKDFIEPVFNKNGVTKFNSEPWTDCRYVRMNVTGEDGKNIEVINAGNGGYDAHRDSEYAQFSDVNAAEKMMVELCEAVGTDKQYTSDIEEERRYSWSGYSSQYSSPYSSYSSFDKKGSFVWAFNSDKAKDRYMNRIAPKFTGGVTVKSVGKQSVKVSGEKLYLTFAYMFAFNCDNQTSYSSWNEFAKKEPIAAAMFERDYEEDKEAGSVLSVIDPSKDHKPDEECAICINLDSEEDAAVAEDAVLDLGLAVTTEVQDTGDLVMSGELSDIKKAYIAVLGIRNGVDMPEDFNALSKNDRDEFWSIVTFDADTEGDTIDAEWTEGGKDGKEDEDTSVVDFFKWADEQKKK